MHRLAIVFAMVLASTGHTVKAQEPDKTHAHGPFPHAHWHAGPEAIRTAVALQQGGHVVFMRHAKTDMLAVDAAPLDDLTDCTKQRNLSPSGVAASAEMGEAIKQLKIPVGKVLSSPYCRTLDTARVAFGNVEATTDLQVRRTEQGFALEEAGANLKRLLAEVPAAGTNTVLVAHIFNAQSALGLTLEEGEAVVVKPNGTGGFDTVGRVSMTAWGDIVRDLVVFKMDPAMLSQGHGLGHGKAHGHGTGHSGG